MTTSPSNPILTDRTSEETDELCGMKYWWYKLEGGKGIVPIEESVYLTDGKDIHNDLALFGEGASIEEVVSSIPLLPSSELGQCALERYTRRIAWAVSFGLYIEPTLREFGEEVACEDEIILDRDPLWFGVIPDRVQRRKGGGLVYREWKSAKYLKKEWQDHWLYAIQLHLGIKALEEELGEPVEYGQVLGLNKGFDRDGRLIHPYVWAYRKGEEWSHEYKYGWDHAPVWEYPGGVVEWVKRCGPEVGLKQFAWSAPVYLDQRLLDRWIEQRLRRHAQIQPLKFIAQTDKAVRDSLFDQRLIHCRPSFGPECPYLAACHNASVNQSPLGSGLYVPRTPHHDLELIGIDEP